MQKKGWWTFVGSLEYGKAWRLQQTLVEMRRLEQIPDILLLCEHPSVITIGRRPSSRQNILSTSFPVYEVERGGDVTYHGPGQLIGYPIFKLEPYEQDPHVFLRRLEESLIKVCQFCGVLATRKEKHTGVWTHDQQRKLASLGVALRQGISFHGFALNVDTDLSAFTALNPCGLPAQIMTSLGKERALAEKPSVTVTELLEKTADEVGQALGRKLTYHSASMILAKPIEEAKP